MTPLRLSCAFAILAACGDNSAGPVADADAAGDGAVNDTDAALDAPTTQAISIPFVAKVDGAPFACGQTYPNIGSTDADFVGIDFRFYVHDVRLITSNGDVALTLDVNSFQTADGIALLDFETGGGACQMGTVATHSMLTGSVPIGTTFTGVKFVVGIPFAKNHLDSTLAVAPLNVPPMYWAWSSGYKFIKIDGVVNGSGFSLHIGSTACGTTGTTPPSTPCASPNLTDVTLLGFHSGSVIVADVGPVLADVDVTSNTMGTAPGCMSFPGDPECDTVMPKLGLPYGTIPAGAQQFLSLE